MEKHIFKSNATFKINQFLKKSESSLLIAKHHLDIPSKIPEAIFWHQWSIVISYYSMLYSAKALILSKGYEVKTHEATIIALKKYCLSNEIDKEYLEILNQAHKIFENEYITYFSKALKESNTARYNSLTKYDQRQAKEIFNLAQKFNSKIFEII